MHHCWHDDGVSWTVKASGELPKGSGGAFYLCSKTGKVYVLAAEDTWRLQGIPNELLERWREAAPAGRAPAATDDAVRRVAGNAITRGTAERIVDDIIVGRQVQWHQAVAQTPELGEARGLEPERYGCDGAARQVAERRAVSARYGREARRTQRELRGFPLLAAWWLSVVAVTTMPTHAASAATVGLTGSLGEYTSWAAAVEVERRFGGGGRQWVREHRYGKTTPFDPHGLRHTAAGAAFPAGVTPPRPTASRQQAWSPAFANMIPKIADHLVLGGLTMNTSNQYAASFDQWVRFTKNMNADGVEQFPVLLTGEDPARDERHLLAFVAYEGWLMGNKPATVSSKLSGVRWYHLDNGLPHPTEGKHRLAAALRALKRLRGEGSGKHPVTPHQLRHIKSKLDFDNPRHVVQWAAVTMGFFLMMRCSEYLAEGTTFDPVRAMTSDKLMPHADGVRLADGDYARADSLTALFEVSKTDQNRIGCTCTIFATGDDLCPVAAYKALRAVRGATWQPKAPAMADADGWVLSRQAMAAVLKASAEDLQMDGAEFATHSLRIGGATAMAATRLYSDDEVRRFGRWKSDCWRRYVYAAHDAVRNLAAAMSRVHVVTEPQPSASASSAWRRP